MTESENDASFRDLAAKLSLKIAEAKWRLNGTSYADPYLDAAARAGIDPDQAVTALGIKLAGEMLALRRSESLTLDDLESACDKLNRLSWVDAHAHIESAARAWIRQRFNQMEDLDESLADEAAELSHKIGDPSITPKHGGYGA